jgi:hypothetical protein
MFLYFAYNKNNYIQQVTHITFQKKYVNEYFIPSNADEDIFNNQIKRSNIDFYVDWDIEKGNLQEYYVYLMQTNKKKLSLLMPINTDKYNTLCDGDKKKYAEQIEPYYEEK